MIPRGDDGRKLHHLSTCMDITTVLLRRYCSDVMTRHPGDHTETLSDAALGRDEWFIWFLLPCGSPERAPSIDSKSGVLAILRDLVGCSGFALSLERWCD